MRHTHLIVLLLAAIGCGEKEGPIDTGTVDTDPLQETGCDSPQTWYADEDGYGYGRVSVEACEQPSGTVEVGGDCDDSKASVNPAGVEVCNGLDDDCDGEADVGATDAPTWYLDSDGDGFGDIEDSVVACEAPSDTVSDGTDCDDEDSDTFPGATEVCDGLDNSCEGDVDEGLSTSTWYNDADGDGFGDASAPVEDCAQPSGTSSDSTDCDDTDSALKPDGNGLCAQGGSCQDLYDRGHTSDGAWVIDVDGHGSGEDPFEVYCDQTEDGGGWTLLLSADGASTVWGNNSSSWTSTGSDAPPATIDAAATDFHGAAYDLLLTDEVRLCYQTTASCHVFSHGEGISLFDFFDTGTTYTEFSVDSYGIADAGSSQSMTDYLSDLGGLTVWSPWPGCG